MSDHGYITITIRFDAPYALETVARVLNEVSCCAHWSSWGNCWSVERGLAPDSHDAICYSGEATWLETEAGDLALHLAALEDELGIPVSAWRATVAYESFEEPTSNGALVEFDIADGKICNWKESVVKMVDATPWFEFSIPPSKKES